MAFSAKRTVRKAADKSRLIASSVAGAAAEKISQSSLAHTAPVAKVQQLVASTKATVDDLQHGPSLAYRAGDFVGGKLREAGVALPGLDLPGGAQQTATSDDGDIVDTYVVEVDEKQQHR
ncbi:hypothetical protein ACFPVT_04765 [Corynebacterium choanae]|uniref:Uncharacterized protein n=1 Tax=Corynebacterium choanae TaxID=1862358 RepID=A0A3G6J8X6_9CORY|nr:hypothetical protein [Corynebacterium choanae]AZA14517.1 hypothetical protein CCHOA_10690 [Corynebacterium choanae]